MTMRILLVDDEPLARARLRALLDDCRDPDARDGDVWSGGFEVGEAAQAVQAMEQLQHQPWDLLLLDIHMPGLDGLGLARQLKSTANPPAVVFVTAHAEHALDAFELDAVDYLTKPVRQLRLQQAIDKAARRREAVDTARPTATAPGFLLIHERGRTERVPLSDIVYLKAELKYVTVRTVSRSYIYDGSLHELEQAHPGRWLRIHRNALVARHRLRALEKGHDPLDPTESWLLAVDGVDDRLPVSRRQLAAVRDALMGASC